MYSQRKYQLWGVYMYTCSWVPGCVHVHGYQGVYMYMGTSLCTCMYMGVRMCTCTWVSGCAYVDGHQDMYMGIRVCICRWAPGCVLHKYQGVHVHGYQGVHM